MAKQLYSPLVLSSLCCCLIFASNSVAAADSWNFVFPKEMVGVIEVHEQPGLNRVAQPHRIKLGDAIKTLLDEL